MVNKSICFFQTAISKAKHYFQACFFGVISKHLFIMLKFKAISGDVESLPGLSWNSLMQDYNFKLNVVPSKSISCSADITVVFQNSFRVKLTEWNWQTWYAAVTTWARSVHREELYNIKWRWFAHMGFLTNSQYLQKPILCQSDV